jgi:hypothetical protein
MAQRSLPCLTFQLLGLPRAIGQNNENGAVDHPLWSYRRAVTGKCHDSSPMRKSMIEIGECLNFRLEY